MGRAADLVDLLITALCDNREAAANLLTDYQQSMARSRSIAAMAVATASP